MNQSSATRTSSKMSSDGRESVETGPIDLAHAIEQLLANENLRNEFEKSADQVAKMLNLAENDRTEFVSLSPTRIQREAEAILNKRWHEIRRLVPQTVSKLGNRANEVFRQFATHDWPHGHRRHPVDAFRFLQFLIANQIHVPNDAELKRMRRLGSS